MPNELSNLEIAKRESPLRQIREHVRDLILSGTLAMGDRLAPTEQLAALWKTHPSAVHRALSELVREGLLVRRRGHGTFVAKRISRLQLVGVYCGADVLLAPWQTFNREIIAALSELMRARGYEIQIYADSRKPGDRNRMWEEIERAAEDRKIQGLIRIIPNLQTAQWMSSLPLPLAVIGPDRWPHREAFSVDTDNIQLAGDAVAELAKQGCRSVGFIGPIKFGEPNGPWQEFHQQFVESAERHGLKFKNSWFRKVSKTTASAYGHFEFGHREAEALLQQPDRPEGLLIWPDSVAQGALTAFGLAGVRVPEDMRLILHRNEKLPYACAYPVTYAVTSERAIAEALIEQLETQVTGGKCKPILLPFKFVDSHEIDHS